jgi:hypothetical protein
MDMDLDPSTVLADSVVEVAAETYAVVTTDTDTDVVIDTFATIDDGRETTHVVPETRLDAIPTVDCEPGWRLLTFDVVLPFELVGFLAVVATALAEHDVSIFALSAYSTDHLLVRQDDLEAALETLSDLGCGIRWL